MRTDKYMMAKAWMKQDQAPQAEALETWNTLEAEFNEERKAMLMASAESDKIKDALFAKSSERIEGIKPNVASTVFDDINPEEPTEQEEE